MFSRVGLCFGMVVGLFHGRQSLLLENLALRQQLVALKRRHPRPSLNPFDKLFWVIAGESGRIGSTPSSCSNAGPGTRDWSALEGYDFTQPESRRGVVCRALTNRTETPFLAQLLSLKDSGPLETPLQAFLIVG